MPNKATQTELTHTVNHLTLTADLTNQIVDRVINNTLSYLPSTLSCLSAHLWVAATRQSFILCWKPFRYPFQLLLSLRPNITLNINLWCERGAATNREKKEAEYAISGLVVPANHRRHPTNSW
ncbi:hypothetical protein L204_102766 [Cryptococcus depauperatus]